MNAVDIIVPVKNEAANVGELCRRIDASLKNARISYGIIFIVDKSTDNTLEAVQKLVDKYPITVYQKTGQPGKAESILEGAQLSTAEYLVMIDGDLQYPPEAIPEMFALRDQFALVVANRTTADYGWLRHLASRVNHIIFNRILLGLTFDVQSGLKLFKREIIANLDRKLVGEWAIDAPLLYTTLELGYHIGSVDIVFSTRAAGRSKIHLLPAALNIILGSLRLRLAPNKVYPITPAKQGSQLGAGLAFGRKRFITHSTLSVHHTALKTFVLWQKLLLLAVVSGLAVGIAIDPSATLTGFIAILTAIYFIDVLFNLFLVLKSLHFPPEISFSDKELSDLDEKGLPIYSILCPLYHEAQVLPQFIANIEKLDWPKNKLDVLLLLEEDDQETIDAARKLDKPNYLRVIIVPHSQPKTKPKACNYGLSLALGEFVVIYDAEDQPEPEQLKKAYLGFQNAAQNVYCLQAKLNYYNPHHNLLTKLFTAEYSLWFDLVLPGLQSINTAIPLGGTSNHFRKKDLLALSGWDAFNVTEDCDLGMRLFKLGYKTAIIDSVTLEEANSDFSNWIRQRSRWIKGYFQTYLVHMRDPIKLVGQLGWHALVFQLVIGARMVFILINPILWLATIAYFTLYALVGPAIEALYPTPVFYMAVFSLVIGNFVALYNYMIGAAKRGQWGLVKYVFLVPIYWLLVSLAAVKATFQLFAKAHFWEKTIHGFHLNKSAAKNVRPAFSLVPNWVRQVAIFPPKLIGPALLVGAALLGNFLNFLYNAYLGRVLNLEQFALISLFGSFIYLVNVLFGPLYSAITHQSAFLLGKHQEVVGKFWSTSRRKVLVWSLICAVVWLGLIPLMPMFFQTRSILPFLLFSPVWILGMLSCVDDGFIAGSHRFGLLAFLIVLEAASKLGAAWILISGQKQDLVYAAVPVSMLVAFSFGYPIARRLALKVGSKVAENHDLSFPRKFFFNSIWTKISAIAFLGMDVILVNHYLSAQEAGQYGLLSLVGKMVVFSSSLFNQFLIPMVSWKEGARESSTDAFGKIFILSMLAGLASFVVLGLGGSITVPILWGEKGLLILAYLPKYTLAMVLLTLSLSIVTYHQVRKQNLFVVLGVVLGLGQLLALSLWHDSITTVVSVISLSAAATLLSLGGLHLFYEPIIDLAQAGKDFLGLFARMPGVDPNSLGKLRILIFNWRDTRHVWSGGAEVYIQELSKRWVQMGHSATIFCGNDGHCPRYETIDGVSIIRRGGFYFVYIWAFLYYLLKLRGKFDVIIDCENGIPFFTPLFAKERKFLLIHHVHQEVFRKGLSSPLAWMASFLEKTAMPIIYRHEEIITVSPSSKADILDHKLTKKEPEIVYNGVDLAKYKPGFKNPTPMVLYLGRLKFYKSLPIFIRSAEKVLAALPNVQFVIAGDGEEKDKLIELTKRLKINNHFQFLGKVTEVGKVDLYKRAWLFVNPSYLEGWGITTIEANACGTPVVASNVAGLRDSVHNPHSGVLVPYGDVDGFAQNIVTLLKNDKLRQTMSAEAVVWAKKFDWNKSANHFLEIVILNNQK